MWKESASALFWIGVACGTFAFGYLICKAIKIRKKEKTDRMMLMEKLEKFPDKPAPPGHTAPLKRDVLYAMLDDHHKLM
ncbi:hypothetical protein T11_12045 [Trichinella zimbabwensis]|uniref:Uncharacterized protein n=1 Tax=Trichinella zimbabwensis TaxID=268475 RepID=A0A0V1G910_9BILA|nr:hypothetical protein T11_12045 [Trichinella zimbabwensis]